MELKKHEYLEYLIEITYQKNGLVDYITISYAPQNPNITYGPAKVYVPMFLEHHNSLIHLVGYAAEETLARKLLDAKREDTVTIGSHVYHKNAVVKTTREMTSHATEDELLKLINLFTNVKFLGINHGNTYRRKESVL